MGRTCEANFFQIIFFSNTYFVVASILPLFHLTLKSSRWNVVGGDARLSLRRTSVETQLRSVSSERKRYRIRHAVDDSRLRRIIRRDVCTEILRRWSFRSMDRSGCIYCRRPKLNSIADWRRWPEFWASQWYKRRYLDMPRRVYRLLATLIPVRTWRNLGTP